MSLISNVLLRECLLESTLKEIREIEAMDYNEIKATDNFKKRIWHTIDTNNRIKKEKYSPKKVVFIFVAAILASLFAMFIISAELRKTVADFFVNVYETFTELFIVEGNVLDTNTQDTETTKKPNPTTIETEYKPTYIDENGYIQLDKIINKGSVFTVWTNETVIIDMTQNIIEKTNMTLDTEDASHQVKYIGFQKVYCVLKNNVYFVQWVAHGYSFSLSCDEMLGWEEVEKIILSVEPVGE